MVTRGANGRFQKRYDSATASRGKVRLYRGAETTVVNYPSLEEGASPINYRPCRADRYPGRLEGDVHVIEVANGTDNKPREWGRGMKVVSLDSYNEFPEDSFSQPFRERVDEFFCTDSPKKENPTRHLALVY